MHTIPFIASDPGIMNLVSAISKQFEGDGILFIHLTNYADALEYMTIEMPELVFINFSDTQIDTNSLLNKIMSDSWLLHGGIIGFCKSAMDIEGLENIKGANLIIALSYDDLLDHLPKMINIIFNNRRILYQRGISADFLKSISGSFLLNNDPYEVKCYVNLICNFLYNSNRLKLEQKFNLKLALTELLMNAIEHGNCQISFEEKTEWLEKCLDIGLLIKQKIKDPLIQKRRVILEYTLTEKSGRFMILDEGDGFDWRNIKDVTKDEFLLELHGRGILITRSLVDNLLFNEKGNQVSFEIEFEKEYAGLLPGLFESIPIREIKTGEVIFREGELSNFLYYIVKGKYDVIINDEVLSVLTPDDIFMGEMSFLLNNRRSATVKSHDDGILIEISKKEFVEAVKIKPHYALFLCRLLAQRIQRSNIRR
jgi:anti-sigma regulatory factor (Ser/Thr protein kinase)